MIEKSDDIDDILECIEITALTDPQKALDKITQLKGVNFDNLCVATGIIKRQLIVRILARMLLIGLKDQRFDYVAKIAHQLDRLQNRHCSDKYVLQHWDGSITKVTSHNVTKMITLIRGDRSDNN